jgi:hypothetical protein
LRSEGLERAKIMIYTLRRSHKSSSAANRAPLAAITLFRRGRRGGGFYNSAPKWAAIRQQLAPKRPFFFAPRRSALRQTPGILGKCRNVPPAEMKKHAAI